VSDLHGNKNKYEKLFNHIYAVAPEIVFIGGDILPSGIMIITNDDRNEDFIDDYLLNKLTHLKKKMGNNFPEIYVIMGNDDPRIYEEKMYDLESKGLWKYINQKNIVYKSLHITGYSFVPPTPFLLKDWEKYDVSRFIDVGCVSPEEGYRSVSIADNVKKYSTISEDLELVSMGVNFSNSIFLFHSPPYKTNLDRIDTKGKMVDHAPVDENVGSIAIRKFIEKRKPLLTLHGHIHESTDITKQWKDYIGDTLCINGSHNGPELCVVKIEINEKINCERSLL